MTTEFSGTDAPANSSSASAGNTTSASTSASQAPSREPFDYIAEDGSLIGEAKTEAAAPEPVEKPAEDPAQDAKAKAAKQALTPGLKKRIDGLTAEKREAQKQILQLQKELDQWRTAYELRESIAKQKESRLAEIEPMDPVMAENEQLKLEQTLRQKQQELEQAYQRRVQEAENQAKTKALVDRWSEEVEEAIEAYPAVSKPELILSFKAALKQDPKTKIADVAKKIDEQRYQNYEGRVLAKYKNRLVDIPQPTAQNGHIVPPRSGNSDDDLIAYLDATLGENWGKGKRK